MRTVVIVQARMSSTRLPGKIMKQVLGRPLIDFLMERLSRVRLADQVVIATTTNPADDIVAEWCQSKSIPHIRGSEQDVLERYIQAAHQFNAQTIVRITSDCPLIDPALVDKMIAYYQMHQEHYDYMSNALERTYPRGMDTEVFSLAALEKAHEEARAPIERELVTIYMYWNPKRFRITNVPDIKDRSQYRLTVDTPEDFELIRRMFETLYPKNPAFGVEDMVQLLEAQPDLAAINAHIEQKVYSRT
jgi:spore coat polysaccharide biosynthesis protein SpsF